MKIQKVLLRFLAAPSNRKLPKKNRDISSFAWNFLTTEIFWNTVGFRWEIFSTVRQYILDKKSWNSLWSPPSPEFPKTFRYQKDSETQKVSPTKFFGVARQQNFNGKSWNSPAPIALSYPKNYKIIFFLKHQMILLRVFRHFEMENFPQKIVMLALFPSLARISENFSIPQSFWNTERFTNEVFRCCETT